MKNQSKLISIYLGLHYQALGVHFLYTIVQAQGSTQIINDSSNNLTHGFLTDFQIMSHGLVTRHVDTYGIL